MNMITSYSPVQYVYREVIEEEIEKHTEGKIFFFTNNNQVDSISTRIESMQEIEGEGIFILLETKDRIRIDRIITLFGKPGAAYEEYDAFGNVCLSCTGGYPM